MTVPEVFTVPWAKTVLLHVPPASPVASLNTIEYVGHTVIVPAIAPGLGKGLTVTLTVAAAIPQLLVTVYEIVVVPAAMPVTTPDEIPIAAVDGFTDVQTPLASPPELLSVVVVVGQTTAVPVIVPALGNGLTVMS
jgi:hypothetical protein